MDNNLFASAKFGDKFRTRDGSLAIYWANPEETGLNRNALIVEGAANGNYITCDNNGYCLKNHKEHQCDIISKWEVPIVCKCRWKDYYDYRIMLPNGEGHVRVSFFKDEIIISDLFVSEKHRHKGYATSLLDKVDELLNGKHATIYPLEIWQKKWYEKRGYTIYEDKPIDDE